MSPLNPWKLSGYKAGQNVVCRVVKDEPGGYAVIIPKDNLPGFLPTQALLRHGEEILAQFVCVHNHRILLSARFSNNTSKLPATQTVRWEEHLEDMDQQPAQMTPQDQMATQQMPQTAQPLQFPQQQMQQPAAAAADPGQMYNNYSTSPVQTVPAQPSGNGGQQGWQSHSAAIIPQQAPQQVQQPAPQPMQQSQQMQQPMPQQMQQPMQQPMQQSQQMQQPQQVQQPPQQQQMQQPVPQQMQQQMPQQAQGQQLSAPQATPPQNLSAPSHVQSRLIPIPQNQPIQLDMETEAERAFGVWASTPRKFHLKRATDLILPPIEQESLNEFKIEDYDIEWLITDLEGGMRTGCVKAACESKLSRSAMLLYRGRAVGCIYGCKSMPDTQPTEQSLSLMLSDLEVPDTDVKIYDLPENVTLAMSALFLGYPVQRNDDYDARAYMDYICGWFESKKNTACLAITLPSNSATCLGFVYKGEFCGAFYVEDQKFQTDKEFVYELLRNDPRANVEASILPPEMTSSAVRFGFSLSMAKKRNDGR